MSDQPLTWRIDLTDITDFAAALSRHPEQVSNEIRKMMQISLDTLEQTIAGNTPVNNGLLRGSLTNRMQGHPATWLVGEVFSPLIYAEPVEHGRKPGKMPPVDAIELWVIRKLGISDPNESRQVAFAIARKIAKYGTAGAGMFQKGFDQASGPIMRLWDTLPDKILQYLEEA